MLVLLVGTLAMPVGSQQVPSRPPSGAIAEITAGGPQRREGPVYIADKDVDIRYLDNLTTAVKDGDEVSIIPAVAGG